MASPTPGHAAAFAKAHGIPKAFTDYRKMLELPEVDLVVIGAPNDVHCSVTCDAAAAGKHVVCEKPLAPSLAEALEVASLVRAAGIVFQPCHQYNYAPPWRAVVDRLPRLGELHFVEYNVRRTAANAGNAALYTSANYTSTTYVNSLAKYNPNPFTAASNLGGAG